MIPLIIIQTTTPDYRSGFFNELYEKLEDDFTLYRGSNYFEKSIKADRSIKGITIKNYFLFGRRFLFQSGIWHLLFKNCVLVLEMNPRILSNWMLLIARKAQGKKTVLWGHAWPRKGKDSNSDMLRQAMRKLATSIVVYTKEQQRELQEKMPSKDIFAAPNALMSTRTMDTQATQGNPLHLIYVGRLTKAKKPMFLLKGFASILSDLPEEAQLIIVGDGEEREEMSLFINKNALKDRVLMKGHVHDNQVLSTLYNDSFFSVSPGYVGLSITQSFGFGVPMLISKNENHSPEIEAAIEGENAIFYQSDDLVRFRESVLTAYKNKQQWIARRPEIKAFCKENYSVEAMAQVFVNLAKTYGT